MGPASGRPISSSRAGTSKPWSKRSASKLRSSVELAICRKAIDRSHASARFSTQNQKMYRLWRLTIPNPAEIKFLSSSFIRNSLLHQPPSEQLSEALTQERPVVCQLAGGSRLRLSRATVVEVVSIQVDQMIRIDFHGID